MITDINGYLIFKGQGANIESYGADSSAADNHSAIDDAINSDYRIIVIPESELPFIISKPINMVSDKTILVKGELKIQDGNIRDLAADMLPTDTTVTVTDADLYFAAGQQVCISDDDMPLQGGGAGHTRRESDAFVIVSVVDDIITLDGEPERIKIVRPGESYTTASNAKIGHTQSVITCDSIDSVKFVGHGCINDNNANQYDVEPVSLGEDTSHGCAISFSDCTNISVANIELKNSILHNITLRTIDGFTINSVNSHDAHDKSVLFIGVSPDYTKNGVVTDSVFSDSEFEDGLSFYSRAKDISVVNCTSNNNGRHGVLCNDDMTGIAIQNITAIENGSAALIRSNGIVFSGNNVLSGDGMYKNSTTKTYALRMENSAKELSNIIISGGNNGDGVILMTNIVDGILSNITIKDTSESVNSGIGLKATSVDNTTLTLNDVIFTNLKVDSDIAETITII